MSMNECLSSRAQLRRAVEHQPVELRQARAGHLHLHFTRRRFLKILSSSVSNVRLPTCFRAQTGPASHSDKTYGFPARKICAIKGMTLETDGEPFLNRWVIEIGKKPSSPCQSGGDRPATVVVIFAISSGSYQSRLRRIRFQPRYLASMNVTSSSRRMALE